jgi:signal transduction histidine kinase
MMDETAAREAAEALHLSEERVRVAREMLDTLLQGFHGLMLRFQVARDMLPAHPEEAMQSLDDALAMADQAITEGRDAIQDLGPAPAGPVDQEY